MIWRMMKGSISRIERKRMESTPEMISDADSKEIYRV